MKRVHVKFDNKALREDLDKSAIIIIFQKIMVKLIQEEWKRFRQSSNTGCLSIKRYFHIKSHQITLKLINPLSWVQRQEVRYFSRAGGKRKSN